MVNNEDKKIETIKEHELIIGKIIDDTDLEKELAEVMKQLLQQCFLNGIKFNLGQLKESDLLGKD